MTQFELHPGSPTPDTKLIALRAGIAGLRLMYAAVRLRYVARKANFNPNQPRVPRGNPDGGQWTRTGGSGATGPRPPSSSVPKIPRSTPAPDLRIPQRGATDVSRTPLGKPPKVPRQRPLTARQRNSVVKEAAKWLARAAGKRAFLAIELFTEGLNAVQWVRENYPTIQSYFDDPKPLDELRKAASTPANGYQIHHIVEQTPAERDGFPRSQIDAPDNLVRIPTLRHHEINGWYQTKNEDYGSLTPREYLRDRDWAERTRVGLDALVKHGVLMP